MLHTLLSFGIGLVAVAAALVFVACGSILQDAVAKRYLKIDRAMRWASVCIGAVFKPLIIPSHWYAQRIR